MTRQEEILKEKGFFIGNLSDGQLNALKQFEDIMTQYAAELTQSIYTPEEVNAIILADREDAVVKATATISCYEEKPCSCYSSSDCYARTVVIDRDSILSRKMPELKK